MDGVRAVPWCYLGLQLPHNWCSVGRNSVCHCPERELAGGFCRLACQPCSTGPDSDLKGHRPGFGLCPITTDQ